MKYSYYSLQLFLNSYCKEIDIERMKNQREQLECQLDKRSGKYHYKDNILEYTNYNYFTNRQRK